MNQILYFTKEVFSKLKEKSNEKGLSMSSYVRMCLIEKWAEEEKEGK